MKKKTKKPHNITHVCNDLEFNYNISVFCSLQQEVIDSMTSK